MRSEPLILFHTFSISLGLTLLTELVIAFLFKLKARDLLLVILVNVLTNPVVVYLNLLFSTLFPNAVKLWQLPLEIAAVLTEGYCYSRFLTDKAHPWLLSALANTVSYSLGLAVNYII